MLARQEVGQEAVWNGLPRLDVGRDMRPPFSRHCSPSYAASVGASIPWQPPPSRGRTGSVAGPFVIGDSRTQRRLRPESRALQVSHSAFIDARRCGDAGRREVGRDRYRWRCNLSYWGGSGGWSRRRGAAEGGRSRGRMSPAGLERFVTAGQPCRWFVRRCERVSATVGASPATEWPRPVPPVCGWIGSRSELSSRVTPYRRRPRW